MASEKVDHDMATTEKPAQSWHIDGVEAPGSQTEPEKGAVNALMILACIAFGSASFVFGFDDKVISPLAALSEFVRPPPIAFWYGIKP